MSVYQGIWDLWQSCVVLPQWQDEATRCADIILNKRGYYRQVGTQTGVPYDIVGCWHYRESNFDFSTHLANGDPLWNSDGRPVVTVNDPKGLGPYLTWMAGAVGAIKHEGFTSGHHWDLVNALDNSERWNGLGYRDMNLNSPYIWSGTNHYAIGKYGSDGNYDPNLVDKQIGCAAILLTFKNRGIDLNELEPAA